MFHLYQQVDSKYSTTKMRLIITALLFFTFFLGENRALDIANYTAYIDQLMLDEQFVEEYAKWSFQLFSQPDYLYGPPHDKFPCPAAKDSVVPTSVHALRPSDINCVGAMGDSLSAGLGAHAITPLGLYYEIRGINFSRRSFSLCILFSYRCGLVDRWRSYIHKSSYST